MTEIEEVDKRLTADFIMTEDEVYDAYDSMQEIEYTIALAHDKIKQIRNRLVLAYHGVMCKLTEFAPVLESLQDEELQDEIQVYNKLSLFKLEIIQKWDDSERFDFYKEGKIAVCGYYGMEGFFEVVRFPSSYIYRMDWIYRLEVELGVFRLKQG